MAKKLPHGATVKVINSLLYTGRLGTLEYYTRTDPEDWWDANVRLDDGRVIGVSFDQVVLTGVNAANKGE